MEKLTGIRGEVSKEGRQRDNECETNRYRALDPNVTTGKEEQRRIPDFRTWVSNPQNTRPLVKEHGL